MRIICIWSQLFTCSFIIYLIQFTKIRPILRGFFTLILTFTFFELFTSLARKPNQVINAIRLILRSMTFQFLCVCTHFLSIFRSSDYSPGLIIHLSSFFFLVLITFFLYSSISFTHFVFMYTHTPSWALTSPHNLP